MKIEINCADIRDGINKLLSVVDKKNSRPILSNCLVNVKEHTIELTASDLEVSAKIILNSKNSGTGQFCINTKNLSDILREMPNETLNLDLDQSNNLKLSCKNINYSLVIIPADEYPQLNFSTTAKTFYLRSKEILEIINKTSHAISTDETRLYLNGIYLQTIDAKLRAVAIDGHRLALLNVDEFRGDISGISDGVIIPRKGINELKKIAETFLEDEVQLAIDESFIYAKAKDNYFLSIRLIAREYPKYQTVIPAKTSFSFRIDKSMLLDAVKRIKILSNEKTNGIKVQIKKNEIILNANHPSLGQAIEKIAVNYDGKEMDIGFNAKYLMDTLSVFEGGEIVLEFNNELSPVVLKSEDLPAFLGIIMPLKL